MLQSEGLACDSSAYITAIDPIKPLGVLSTLLFSAEYLFPVMSPTPENHDGGAIANLQQAEIIYARERDKRIRSDGNAQYINLSNFEKLPHAAKDPWIHVDRGVPDNADLLNQQHRILIIGAGYGGLLAAVRLLQMGFSLDDILLVDAAGGFGGTWYWNRYPGLMCDVESYIYMPLLEETRYMPKHKYAAGTELRQHALNIAAQWKLDTRAVFRTTAKEMMWLDDDKCWKVELVRHYDSSEQPVTIRADFVLLFSGLLNTPKLPNIPGIEQFRGHMFHTSRWDYDYTGGSPEQPALINLKDKKVAIVGTGATAIQAVPQTAKWAQHLYVVQRTPSAVDVRGNRKTDPEWWEHEVISRGKGWQRERMENYNAFLSGAADGIVDLVQDAWTSLKTYCTIIGGPSNLDPDFLSVVKSRDLTRQNWIHQRVDDIVHEETTAKYLKPWYPTWCKRPCFHDEYLQAFNNDNVTLVDTDGKGITRFTEDAIVVGENEINVDAVIFSTGFRLGVLHSPADGAGMSIIGRAGKSMAQKWLDGVATLHGMMSHDFPNLFFPGAKQGGGSPNYVYLLDQVAQHIAFVMDHSLRGAGGLQEKISIEPSIEAEEAWSRKIMSQARAFAGVQGCTPSYFNREGAKVEDPNAIKNSARSPPWGGGIGQFIKIVEEWREKGDLAGLEIAKAGSDLPSSKM